MKKFLALLSALALAMALAACSSPTATPDAGDAGGTVMKETINGQEVDFSQNDIVVIADYDGQYVDQLQPMTIDAGGGDSTITIAVFGDIVSVDFIVGEPHSDGFGLAWEHRISSSLITITNAPSLDDYVLIMSFMDYNGTYYNFSMGKDADDSTGLLQITDSGKASITVEPGHELWAVYHGDGYKFIVEVDESQTVQDQPMNFLYLQYDGQDKVLLTRSVDCGNELHEWPNSIRNIMRPMMSINGDKVYYETDAYNHGNGAGANSHFTHVISLDSKEDTFFSIGGLYLLLDGPWYDPYAGYLILQGHENGEEGLVHSYFVVTPEGESYCNLGTYVEGEAEDLILQIRSAATR